MQNWSNLLSYIKARLGVKVNLIELSDKEIIEYIKEHTFPELSIQIGKTVIIKLGPEDRISSGQGYEYEYLIPLKDDMEIIDIYSVYISELNLPIYQLAHTYITLDPRDIAMQNEMIASIRSLMVVQDYYFEPPNILRFGKKLTGEVFFIEARCIFKDPSEIPVDFYHRIFKKKALADIMLLISAMRKKYDNLTTPFGQININWQDLENTARDILSEVYSELDAMPPEYLIAFIDD